MAVRISSQPGDAARDDALEELRISESRYRRLFETARDGILLLNADTGQIEDVNPYLIELLGYTHAEFLGKKLWEVGPFADIAQSKDMFAQLQRVGYVRYENLPLRTKAGVQIAVEFVSNVYDCEGVKVIQCNIRDITAHNEAARVLREYKAIVMASDDAIISKSLDGIIRSWNPGAEKLFGYTAAEAIGQPMLLVIPQDRQAEEALILERLSRGVTISHFETVRRQKNGNLIEISATISPIRDGRNKLVAVSKVARNITERKQAEALRISLEAQLRESQKMEAIGTLAGGIAHDFNNIIATILGNCELALEDTSDDPEVQKSIAEILKAARRARDLVQQILSFSRRQPVERQRMALAPVVEESVSLMRATFPSRIHIETRLDAQVPDILGNATQIEQALLNLATNSMQASGDRPQCIRIRLDTVILDTALTQDQPALGAMKHALPALTVRLAVSDDGPGMDAATLARIFEPFFTTKPMGEGTGLGLAVVRGIMQAHEGAIVVSSQPGRGTTATLYLPVAPALATGPGGTAGPDSPPPEDPLAPARRLLYIDDDVSLVDLVTRLLQRRGYVVSGYSDPQVAMTELARDPAAYDLVVSDYNMPQLSGLDVARRVRRIRPDLPVGVVSGFIDENLLSHARGAGVRELIVKSNDIHEYVAAIRRLAESPAGDPALP